MNSNNHTESALIPFHGATLRVKEIEGEKWVALKPICEHLGISWQGQSEKLAADEKFNCQDILIVAEDGKQRPMTCLNLNDLTGWLYTINPSKIKAASRPRLLAYQKETTRAINDYWTKGQATRPAATSPLTDDPLELLNLSMQALQQQRAQIGQLALKTSTIEQRLDSLPINGAQKRQLHKAVRELARLLGGKPHNYRKAWREFYDRFGLVAYGDLPANRFDEAISFLRKLVEAYQVSDGLGMTLE